MITVGPRDLEETLVGVTPDDLKWWQETAPRLSWKFAKTMRFAPHSYVVNGQHLTKSEHERACRVIHTFADPGKYHSKTRLYLTFGGYRYWTAAGPQYGTDPAWRDLINRAEVDGREYGVQDAPNTSTDLFTPYDAISAEYDYHEARVDPAVRTDEYEAVRHLFQTEFFAYPDATVLDVGCGTGRLLTQKLVPARHWTGVDSSHGMLNHAVLRHFSAGELGRVIPGRVEDHILDLDPFYDVVLLGYGSADYFHPLFVLNQLKPLANVALVLMHYAPGARPAWEPEPMVEMTADKLEDMYGEPVSRYGRFLLQTILT